MPCLYLLDIQNIQILTALQINVLKMDSLHIYHICLYFDKYELGLSKSIKLRSSYESTQQFLKSLKFVWREYTSESEEGKSQSSGT